MAVMHFFRSTKLLYTRLG